MQDKRYVDFALKDGGMLRVHPVREHTFRIWFRPDADFVEPGLVRYGFVRTDWPAADFTLCEKNDRWDLTTSGARLSVARSDGRLTFSDATGRVLLESAGAPTSARPEGFDVRFKLADSERLYGLGDETRDRIQKRGHKTMMWVTNCSRYVPIPFLMSNRGWALFLNTSCRHFVDAGKDQPDQLRLWGHRGALDFFLMTGPTPAERLDRFTDLVGKPALMPLSAYGLAFMATKDADARAVLQDCINFRRDGFPCDYIGIEPTWMSKDYDYSTEKQWHPTRFRLPYWHEKNKHPFIVAAERMGFKGYLWLCCNYDLSWYEEYLATGQWPDPEDYAEFDKELNALFDDPNIQALKARSDLLTKPHEPWFEHLKKFVDQGVNGFMMDAALQGAEHPDRHWANGMDDEEMHNLYPSLLAKQMHEGFRQHTGRRPFLFGSCGYTGTPRYSSTWAGDTGAGPNELVSFLNHGLSGHSNTACDVSLISPDDIHFAFFIPWVHLNAWITWEHPSYLGETLGPIVRDYLRLRYRLLPYIYSAAHVAHRTGLPILRAMPLLYPDDPRWDNCLKQYMFGDAFLVGAFTRDIELPTGQWIDYWSGARIQGPQAIACAVPDNRGGPLLVHGGAIIPYGPDIDWVGQKPMDRLDLHVYPWGQSSYTLYEDDGVTFAYESGAMAVTAMTCHGDNGGVLLTIEPREGTYQGMPAQRFYAVHLHIEREPRSVRVNDSKVNASDSPDGWQYDLVQNLLHLHVQEDPLRRKPVKVEIS